MVLKATIKRSKKYELVRKVEIRPTILLALPLLVTLIISLQLIKVRP